jgi:hypothetical protein
MENLPFGVSGETGGCSGNGSLKVTGRGNVDTPPGIVHHGITPEVVELRPLQVAAKGFNGMTTGRLGSDQPSRPYSKCRITSIVYTTQTQRSH